jgi:small subunit ribosomal protein S35
MASPFKRICLRAASTRPQWRTLATTTPVQASADTSDIDALTSNPSTKSTTSQPEDLHTLENLELSSRAHRELEQHRELREMMRLAAWEMPLLSSLSKPFEPPKEDQILRWRYTTYLGETHPAQHKVVVEFTPSRIPDMNEKQLLKLLKLAGPRYNPEKEVIKMSSDSFGSQAQNKRYLAETISSLIAEAKDLESESFEDVPLDLRHHKPKKRYMFPEEWNMTPERRQQLEGRRRAAMIEEGKKVESGAIVSGIRAIEDARQKEAAVKEPVMIGAGRPLAKGRVGRR